VGARRGERLYNCPFSRQLNVKRRVSAYRLAKVCRPVEHWALKKIAMYGGSFDPIHNGHLILARDAIEQLGLEKLILIPASVSPFKNPPVASAEMRLSMLRAAIEGEMGFCVDDCELRRPPPSYTIDTITDIRQHQPNAEIFCLVGDDNVRDLAKWHRFAELEKLVRFVVLDRHAQPMSHSYPVVRRKIDISATEIRKRVAAGQSIRYLVPSAVEEIIRREKLYREKSQ
jgi:nicotinate-nucleotide adenylyltransferase